MRFVHPFLDIVSDDGKADLVISGSKNISKIFEEYGEELWLMFLLGIITGLIIHGIARFLIKKILKKFFENPTDKSKNQESD